MNHVVLSLVVQLSLMFGVAGLLWPEKLVEVFDVLMFPWPASSRTVRANSIAAIALSLSLLVTMLIKLR